MKLVRTVTAVCVMAVGVVGLVFPLVPGVPLIIGGLALLGSAHPWNAAARRWLDSWRGRAAGSGGAREL